MLEKLSSFLDKLAGLPYWQIALLASLFLVAVVGGYFVLRPPPRPESSINIATEAEPEETRRFTVHVAGAVSHPGVVRLKEGDRVVDAIEEAGGPLPEADLESLNLAQSVQDGQKILVPRKGEAESGGLGTSGEKGSGGKISINRAGQKELEELPGIGPTLAERIVAYREKKGGFKNVEEIKQVSGIGDKKFEEIRDLVDI